MDEKVILGQFAAKISKAKSLHDSTQAVCSKLQKELSHLDAEYQNTAEARKAAERAQNRNKNHLQALQNELKDQNQMCSRQTTQLNELKDKRKDLKRKKDANDGDRARKTLELEDVTKERIELEKSANILKNELEAMTAEKEVLQNELDKTNSAVASYNARSSSLKGEIQAMKQVISQNTVPVSNISASPRKLASS